MFTVPILLAFDFHTLVVFGFYAACYMENINIIMCHFHYLMNHETIKSALMPSDFYFSTLVVIIHLSHCVIFYAKNEDMTFLAGHTCHMVYKSCEEDP